MSWKRAIQYWSGSVMPASSSCSIIMRTWVHTSHSRWYLGQPGQEDNLSISGINIRKNHKSLRRISAFFVHWNENIFSSSNLIRSMGAKVSKLKFSFTIEYCSGDESRSQYEHLNRTYRSRRRGVFFYSCFWIPNKSEYFIFCIFYSWMCFMSIVGFWVKYLIFISYWV